MKNDLASLETELLNRSSLRQYSVQYSQREGWTTAYKWNPSRPASGGWPSGRSAPEARKVPMTVNGKRIAVIDAKAGTIDALVVGDYTSSDNGNTSAVASPNSYLVKWDLALGAITVEQANNPYEVSLGGKKVVGITKGEMTLLRCLAANQPLQSAPQNL